MDILKDVKDFLLKEVAAADSGQKEISADENLIMAGIIDSLGIMKLTSFMEKKFGIKINDDDIVPENFQTLNCLKGFIEKKIGK